MAKAKKTGAGSMTEQIDILSPAPVARVIASITRVGTVATVTTAIAHGFNSGEYVTLSGVTPADYNGEYAVTVTAPTTFTFPIAGTPASPATVPGAVVFTSDSQGGGGSGSWVLDTVWAHIEPMSATEQLAAGGIVAIGSYNATIRYRADVTVTMKISWRRYQEASAKTYEIHSVQPNKNEPRAYIDIEMGVIEG